MLEALQIAATGMQAQQLHLDTTANNLANVNTAGFKRGAVVFQELVSRAIDAPSAVRPDEGVGSGAGAGPRAGLGVSVASVLKNFDVGEMRKTDSAFDVAIAGEGFIEVQLGDGSRAYSRGGTMRVNADGVLALTSGPALAANIAVPDNATAVVVEADGSVLATVPGQARPVEVGRIEMVRFMVPSALSAQGEGLYKANEATGEPIAGRPGENGLGTLRQGYLEGSNVKLVDEMIGLMLAQRAYEASVKVAQAADEMLAMVNGLRK